MRLSVWTVVLTLALSMAALAGAALGRTAPLTTGETAKRCSKTNEFEVWAVPVGSTGQGSDVYVRGIPRKAKHIRLSFKLVRSGAVPPPELFPHQNWVAQRLGFETDGSYAVRVSVSGPGFGMPASTRKRFQVTVSYDCPRDGQVKSP